MAFKDGPNTCVKSHTDSIDFDTRMIYSDPKCGGVLIDPILEIKTQKLKLSLVQREGHKATISN